MTYDLAIDRVTYDLDTTTNKIIGVVGAPSTSLRRIYSPSEISSFTVVKNVFTLTFRVLTQTAEFFFCSLPSFFFNIYILQVGDDLKVASFREIITRGLSLPSP